METGETQSTQETEARVEQKPLPEDTFLFKGKNEDQKKALIVNEGGELKVVMTAPMRLNFQGGEKKVVEGSDGSTTEVLEIQAFGLSGTQGAALMHLQIDKETLTALFGAASEAEILSKPKSKWAPGGKMEQLTRFGMRMDEELGE